MYMFTDNDIVKKRELQRKKREFDLHRMSIENRATSVPTSIANMRDAYQQVVDKKMKPTQKEIEYRSFTSGLYGGYYQSDD